MSDTEIRHDEDTAELDFGDRTETLATMARLVDECTGAWIVMGSPVAVEVWYEPEPGKRYSPISVEQSRYIASGSHAGTLMPMHVALALCWSKAAREWDTWIAARRKGA